jgi:hypothetical protein
MVTWWTAPGTERAQIACERFDERGERLQCVTFEAALQDAALVREAIRIAAETDGALFS